jgi:sialate O-acetylesterase
MNDYHIMNRILLIAILTAKLMFQADNLSAKLVIPQIFSDNMVLQCNAKASIWGWADPKSTVTLKASWLKQTISVRCDKDGKWKTVINTLAPSYSPNTLTISEKGSDKAVIGNILFGEVWFCSGQSNMEMPVSGFGGCPVEGCNEAIAEAGAYPGIRIVKIPKTGAKTPQDTVAGKWLECNADNAPQFSALGYFFARRLSRSLNIPIGIIDCSWGGTTIEGWLPEEEVVKYPDIDFNIVKNLKPGAPWRWHSPSINYNGMVHPLAGYTVKGFTWYQGESNVRDSRYYGERLERLASIWRSDWGEGDIPFLVVEIAPYIYPDDKGNAGNEASGGGTMNAKLIEQQHIAVANIPNSGIISTNDLIYPYEIRQVHPSRKQEVGDRLAYLALNKAYGLKGIACEGPTVKEVKYDSTVVLIFDHVEACLKVKGQELNGFELAGADKVFHPAKASVNKDNKSVTVSSQEVAAPVAVRYCFRNFLIGNLFNSRDLPAAPFRTDNW